MGHYWGYQGVFDPGKGQVRVAGVISGTSYPGQVRTRLITGENGVKYR